MTVQKRLRAVCARPFTARVPPTPVFVGKTNCSRKEALSSVIASDMGLDGRRCRQEQSGLGKYAVSGGNGTSYFVRGSWLRSGNTSK